jgi:hypothetical protein
VRSALPSRKIAFSTTTISGLFSLMRGFSVILPHTPHARASHVSFVDGDVFLAAIVEMGEKVPNGNKKHML